MQSQSPGGIRLGLIFVIADDRTLRIGQMHADLITPTRHWCDFDQCARRASLDHPVMGHSVACPLAGRGTVDHEGAAFIQV